MARLPIPGSDNGTWGDVLNDYLSVAHDSAGTLKSDAVNSSAIQDDSITEAKLNTGSGTDGQVLTKNSGATGGFEWAAGGGAADATTTTKGIIQLTGDLSGTAAAPTVPALTSKVNASTTVSAGTGLTGGGDLSTNRTISANFGTSAGTIAQGNDSRITGAVQSSIVDAKGDLLVATAADTVTRIAVGSDNQVLTADSSQASGVRWATPSSGGNTNSFGFPASGYGFHSASDNLTFFSASGALDQAWFTRVFVPAGNAINAIGTLVKGAGTVGAGGLNGYAIYDDSGTLITSTPDDNTMWQTTGWVMKVLGSPIASQGTDRFIYVGVASRGYTAAPTTAFRDNLSSELTDLPGYVNTKRRVFYNGISSWPASFDPASYGNAAGGYLPLTALA